MTTALPSYTTSWDVTFCAGAQGARIRFQKLLPSTDNATLALDVVARVAGSPRSRTATARRAFAGIDTML